MLNLKSEFDDENDKMFDIKISKNIAINVIDNINDNFNENVQNVSIDVNNFDKNV